MLPGPVEVDAYCVAVPVNPSRKARYSRRRKRRMESVAHTSLRSSGMRARSSTGGGEPGG